MFGKTIAAEFFFQTYLKKNQNLDIWKKIAKPLIEGCDSVIS